MIRPGNVLFDRLICAFASAGYFLKEKVEREGWVWSNNYLREHARCASGREFTNTVSPAILAEVARRFPELGRLINGK